MNKTNFIKKQPESTPCGVRRRRENHARLCLARAGNRGFEVIYANKVSERSERGRESTAQALGRSQTKSEGVMPDDDINVFELNV